MTWLFLAVILRWDASTSLDVIGYKLRYGPNPQVPTTELDVGNKLEAEIDERELGGVGATIYFAAYAYNAVGLESQPSNQVAYVVPKRRFWKWRWNK